MSEGRCVSEGRCMSEGRYDSEGQHEPEGQLAGPGKENRAAEENWEGVVFHVVMGGFLGHREGLEQLAQGHPNICLHSRVEHMAELMEDCDAAVSAAGTMLFELSAMQVPTVFFVSADNQQYDREFFGEEERMLFAGDIRRDADGCLEMVLAGLMRLRFDAPLRERMKKALGRVTDGRGAGRIAEEICQLD